MSAVGPAHSPTLGRQGRDGGFDDVDLFASKRAALTGVRIERSDREPRIRDPVALQPLNAERPRDLISAEVRVPATCASGKWVVTGTVRSVGPASIIATLRRNPAALGDELGLARVRKADCVKLLLETGPVTTPPADPERASPTAISSQANNALSAMLGCPGVSSSAAES